MDSLLTSAASGMRARIETLEMLANNVANSSTAAFKADREFYGLYVSEDAAAGENSGVTESPVIERHWTDFSQGTLTQTGNPLDLAVAGKGFFRVDYDSGPLYTRNGSFKVGKTGRLETADGGVVAVKTLDDLPLRILQDRPVTIATDGTVMQDNRPLGKILMFAIDNTSAVSKHGSTYFQWLGDKTPASIDRPELHQGMIESSNVPVAENAVRLVNVMRQFEMLQRAVSLGAEMNRRAIDEVAKV